MSFRSSGETAVVAMAVGSVLVVMCALTIVLAIQRRRRRFSQTFRCQRRSNSLTGSESSQNPVGGYRMDFPPTDFMKSLASWDRCHPIDEEALEKRRRAVWTLELFENHGIKDSTSNEVDTSTGMLQDC